MFDNLASDLYHYPDTIQAFALDELQHRITGGEPIVDANNVVTVMLEMFSTLTANAINQVNNRTHSLYARRALTSAELFRHMSDYDYVNMYSTPATCELSITFAVDHMIQNALSFNENYKKAVIPKDTVFSIGQYKFGIHYPIEFRINKRTNAFLVSYDTSTNNPLERLERNTIEHRRFAYKSLQLVSIKVPVKQFESDIYIEDITPGIGFSKSYDHVDKFHAVRIFNEVGNNFVEINQTLADTIYDPVIVTAKVDVESDLSRIKVSIPQIYFDRNLIGPRLKVVVYRTKGTLDVDISTIAKDSITANFIDSGNPDQDKFARILERNPTLHLEPTTTKIVGGGDGYGFEELRDRVVKGTFYGDVLITPDDLIKYFEDKGFIVTRHRDGITDRIYHCFKYVTDLDSVIMPAATLPTLIRMEMATSEDPNIKVSPIVRNLDGSLTIKPNTLFKYDYVSRVAQPLSDTQYLQLRNMSKLNRLNELNLSSYTISPYHIRVNTSARYPVVHSYNLLTPSIQGIEFIEENVKVSTQMAIYNTSIEHLDQGSDGYELTIKVFMSEDLYEAPPEDLTVHLTTTTPAGTRVYIDAEQVAVEGTNRIFKAKLDTNYTITQEHYLYITSLRDGAGNFGHFIAMDVDFKVIFMTTTEWEPAADARTTHMSMELPTDYYHLVPLASQLIKLNLGRWVNEVHNQTVTYRDDPVYDRYEEDVYATYYQDIYETDELGVPVYVIVAGELILNKIHSKGDIVLDEENEPIVLHNAGDVRLDSTGNPIVVGEPGTIYHTDLLHIEGKLLWSDELQHRNYIRHAVSLIASYLADIRSAKNHMLENTRLFFHPLRTLGVAEFILNDETDITLPLELSVKFRLHVYDFVKNSQELMDTIRASVINIIDNHIKSGRISCTRMSEEILNNMSDNVVFVDVLGLYDPNALTMHNITLPHYEIQTLVSVDESVRPSLGSRLILEQDGRVGIERMLTIDYVTTT